MCGIALVALSAVIVIPLVILWLAVWGGFKYAALQKEKQVEIAKHQETDTILAAEIPVPTTKAFAGQILKDHFAAVKGRLPNAYITNSLFDAIQYLYVREELQVDKAAPASHDAYEIAKWREKLRAGYARTNDPELLATLSNTFQQSLKAFNETLPPQATFPTFEKWQVDSDSTEETTSVPVYSLMPNVANAIEELVLPFYSKEARERGLFVELRKKLDANMCEVSSLPDVPESMYSPKLKIPTKCDLTGIPLIHAYLKGTSLQHIFTAPVPFKPPENARFSGHWIVAPPNRGKTNLLHTMFLEDATKDASIIILDSKGDLSNPVRTLAEFKDRLVVLEPDEEYPLALNPLDIGASTTHTIELLEYLFSALLDAKTTPLQATLFRSVLLLLKAVPNASFNDLRKILLEGHHAYAAHLGKLHPDDRDFFAKGTKEAPAEFYSSTYKETKAQLLWRIRDLTTRIPILRSMLGAPRLLINMGELMDSGKIVVIDNSKQLLGDDGSEFVGRFFIALIRAAADQRSRRPDSQKKPVYVYIDEAHNVIKKDEKIAGILQECRSQKIALIMAHQAISQIQSTVTLGALTDCAIRYANSDEEASQLAPRLRTTPEFLRSLGIGAFAAFVRDYANSAVRVDIPHTKLHERPQMSSEEQQELRASMRRQYCMPPMIAAPIEDTPSEDALGDLTPQPE